MDYSSPGSSHGILQARILEWVANPFCRESSQPRHWTQVSHIAGKLFTVWATREAVTFFLVLKKKPLQLCGMFGDLIFACSSEILFS